jgi:hypothetical protein
MNEVDDTISSKAVRNVILLLGGGAVAAFGRIISLIATGN